MLSVVSPAKSLDFESKLPTRKFSTPAMLDHSAELVEIMAKKTPEAIGRLMSISPGLSELNFERFQEWSRPFTPENSRPAALAFAGDTYIGLDANHSFSERDFTYAQKVLRILSGLYGVLRPLDLIQPYRLEMSTKLATDRGADLYSFWGNAITDELNIALKASPGSPALVNLASNEYFSAVQPHRLDGRIITPKFLDSKDGGEHKMVGFFAKRARGTMAAWIIQNRVKSVKSLRDFDGMGYTYDAQRSSATQFVYLRSN